MNVASNDDRMPLDEADKQLLADIRALATALVDGPARWDALHTQISAAKKRKIHRKLGVNWEGFLDTFGLTEDDWSRIAVAVDICAVLRTAGLPLPRNHGQLDQLRHLRRDPAALSAFWRKALGDYGSIPPARVLAAMKMPVPIGRSAGSVSQTMAAPDLVALAEEYFGLMRSGQLFDAQRPAQQLAGLLLGKTLNRVEQWRVWPAPHAVPKQLQFELEDIRRAKRRRCASLRSIGANHDDSQLSWDFTGDGETLAQKDGASREFREFRGISANACTTVHTDVSNSAESPPVESTAPIPIAVVGPAPIELMSDDVRNATCKEDDSSRLKAPTLRSIASAVKSRKSPERAVVKVRPNGAAVMWELARHGSKLSVRIIIDLDKSPASLIDAPPGYSLTHCKRFTRLRKSLREADAATLNEEVVRAIQFLVSRGSESTLRFEHLRPIPQDEAKTQAGPQGHTV